MAASIPMREFVIVLIGVFTIACQSDQATSTRSSFDHVLQAVVATPRAITMAVADTQRLTVAAKNLTGQALTDLPNPVYGSSDSTKVTVTSDGVIHGLQTTPSPVTVTATISAGNVTRTDTVYVLVTATRDIPRSLSLQPVDSARIAMQTSTRVKAVYSHDGHDTIPGLVTRFAVKPNTGVSIDPLSGALISNVVGSYWVYATSTAYGVPLTDSVQYTFLYRASTWIIVTGGGDSLRAAGAGATVILQPGAIVSNLLGNSTDTVVIRIRGTGPVLDAVTGEPAEDIVQLPHVFYLFTSIERKLPTVGNYTWWVLADSAALHGNIIIKDVTP